MALCTITETILDGTGTAVPGVVVQFTIPAPQATEAGELLVTSTLTATSDAGGLISIDLLQGVTALVTCRALGLEDSPIFVPDLADADLGSLLNTGDDTATSLGIPTLAQVLARGNDAESQAITGVTSLSATSLSITAPAATVGGTFVASDDDYPALAAYSKHASFVPADWTGSPVAFYGDGTVDSLWSVVDIWLDGVDGTGLYSGTSLGRGIHGHGHGGTYPAGVVGSLKDDLTAGAGVLGIRDGGALVDTALALGGGCGVLGYSALSAGVFGYTPTANLAAVRGQGGHVNAVGVWGGTASIANPAAEIASWAGAGLAGSSKEAGKYGIGGEYLNATAYGEGIEGWNAAWGPGIAGYAANGAGDSWGVIGGLKNTTTTQGAGVCGYHGVGGSFGSGGLWTDATAGACGVFGVSDLKAGVYGYSIATLVPGVLGVATVGNAGGGEFYGFGNGHGAYGQAGGAASGLAGYADGTGAGVLGLGAGSAYGVRAEADTTTPVAAALHIVGQDDFPSSPVAGNVFYHSGNNKHYGYNGSGWQAFY